jgi:ferric-dicitrate binding protein FerR (iron transport regulator)
VTYRDDDEAERLRADARKREKCARKEQRTREKSEAREQRKREEKALALNDALAELSRPQPEFVRRDEPLPSREWLRTMGIVLAIAIALFLVLSIWIYRQVAGGL